MSQDNNKILASQESIFLSHHYLFQWGKNIPLDILNPFAKRTKYNFWGMVNSFWWPWTYNRDYLFELVK